MTHSTDKPPLWLTVSFVSAAVVFAAVVVLAILYFTVFTVSVTVSQRPMRLDSGITVGDLWTRGLIAARRGDLLSAKNGRVLRPGGGKPAAALVDSTSASPSQKLRDGDVVVAINGADAVERIARRFEAIPFKTRVEGVGPVETMIAKGSPGTLEVRYGAVSGAVVSSSVAKAPVTRVTRRSQAGPGAKLIALTFDDGPWPGQTRAVLKILVANNVRATFFEIGSQARARPNLSLAVTRAGMLIGNHTETHNLRPRSLTTAQVAAEISVAEKNITAASGQRPRFFRPPGGIVVPAMFPVLKKLGLRWLEWSIDTDDWQRPPAKTIVARVMRHARPGAVVLMHDGGGDRSHTIAALPVIIAKLKAKGYVFVTLDALRKLPHVMG